MKTRILVIGLFFIAAALVSSGCTDVLTQQKVGGFGDAQGTPAVATPAYGSTGGVSGGSAGSIGEMRTGNIYGMCYPACVNAKEKSVKDCDKACCMAQCQPMTPEDTERCAAVCGVDLDTDL